MLQQAIALGNPSALNQAGDADISYENLRMLSHTIWGDRRSGYTTFGYAMDAAKYDTGCIVIVSYTKNATETTCIENETLGYESYLLPRDVYPHIVPVLQTAPASRIVRAKLKTVKGSVKFSIRELRGQCRSIDPFEYLPSGDDSEDSSLLQEVMHLCRLDSQFIIKPSFVIVDDNPIAFRGYLTPYFAVGSPVDVLNRLEEGKTVTTKPKPDLDLNLHDATNHTAPDATSDSLRGVSDAASMKVLDWSVKEAWALQIISGVASLHNASIFSGDLKLDNILLGHDGCICLIDIAPKYGFSAEYLAPEQDIQRPERVTSTQSLRLVLWALSEEKPYLARSDVIPKIIWNESKDGAPMWYRELVHSCVGPVDQRPSAEMLLSKYPVNAVQNSIQHSRH
ncbi:hypothetical protein BD410DRAFT_824663 [Rickenella mellea]|uniref:Protein kinase domain-containing protein n=1 Tax=Rickenella mellea TaxID=50990 RepID=A0A4Y7QKW5_9AGAM|nr:hypothetical protein BD410DRAFT_824663 [Rickenella mellea]